MIADARWSPAVRAGLVSMLQDPSLGPRPLAAFDWDNTCIRGDIGEGWMIHLDRDGGDRMGTYERMCKEQGKPVGYAWCAFQIAGWTPADLQAEVSALIAAGLADGRFRVRPEMRDLIGAMRDSGWEVRVVSASAEPLVRAFAPHYGIPADDVIGMRVDIGPDGRYLPALAGPLTFRAGKVEAIEAFAGRRPTFAAGDTETDIELLESAKYRLLMDAGGSSARPSADAGGWWVQEVDW